MRLCLLFAVVCMAHVCSAAANDNDEQLPEVPDQLAFTLSAHGAGVNEPNIEGVLELRAGDTKWKFAAGKAVSFAKLWHLSSQWKHDGQELKLALTFECLGPEEPKRRICLETRLLAKNGKLLAHDWQVESDGRIESADTPPVSFRFVRSRLNNSFNTLPRSAITQAARLDIRLIEYPQGMPPHFPHGRHSLDLAITRPNRCGDFDVTFTNPQDWNLDPPKHQIAFQVFVYDADKKFIHVDRRFLMYRADGDYRQSVRVEPKYFDHSRISISVYTRQPDNDKFISDFFYGGGAEYHGCWTGDGGNLVDLPIRGVTLFPDLPELAVARETETNR
jgi:hypothetical protein